MGTPRQEPAQLAPIQLAVHLPVEVLIATRGEQAPANPELFKPVKEKAAAMIDQLLWWGRALRAARRAG